MRDNHKYDYGAWATKNDVLCADGRTIRRNAFKDMDGEVVPLIWNHDHESPYAVIGHALLENRDEGVYSYLSFNDSDLGRHCKNLVEHGDVRGVSIYANKLKQSGKDVLHGVIRELSLVLAGANPEAYIDTVLAHHDDLEEAVVFDYCDEFVAHSDEDPEEKKTEEPAPTEGEPEAESEPESKEPESKESDEDKETTMEKELNNEEQELQHSATDPDIDIEAELNSMTPNQRAATYALVAMASEEGEEKMAHNIFESSETNDLELVHSALHDIFVDAKKYGTLKDSYLAHAEEVQQYGIDHMEYFQKPEGTDIYDRPQFINTKPNGWITKVINGVHHTPFAKVRMMFADITEDEARAKGYIKGNYKKEEFFKLKKRTLEPTTIYKKQKFDRDDLVDADWDIIPWVKAEMAVKLDEEKARAYIFGDGRSNNDEDKVDESKIRPVVKEDELFLVTVEVSGPASSSAADQKAFAEDLIDQMVLAQDDYDGSGNLVAFVESKQVSKMLLLKDEFGHRLYKTMTELASAMAVDEVVKGPASVMPTDHYAVALDLSDYNVGTNNMGKRNMFSDFDIDYNQMKYLLEERQSGGLVRPKSAIVIKKTGAAG